MNGPTTTQLDTYLDRVLHQVSRIRQLNLMAESGLHEALEESQNVLASIAMYRHHLKHLARQEA